MVVVDVFDRYCLCMVRLVLVYESAKVSTLVTDDSGSLRARCIPQKDDSSPYWLVPYMRFEPRERVLTARELPIAVVKNKLETSRIVALAVEKLKLVVVKVLTCIELPNAVRNPRPDVDRLTVLISCPVAV